MPHTIRSQVGRVAQLARREEGQALVEYSLILLLIAVVVIGVLTTFGTQVSTLLNEVTTKY